MRHDETPAILQRGARALARAAADDDRVKVPVDKVLAERDRLQPAPPAPRPESELTAAGRLGRAVAANPARQP